jgi:hypothetical protein
MVSDKEGDQLTYCAVGGVASYRRDLIYLRKVC